VDDRQRLELKFHGAMRDVYVNAKRLGYNATRFLGMLGEHGGLETARILIHADDVSDGYTALWELGRLDLSVEAQALRPEFAALFSDEELEIARSRLADYRFDLAGWLARGGRE
jgi:hypothetical protein